MAPDLASPLRSSTPKRIKDDDLRASKVKAGKERFLAFQKKRETPSRQSSTLPALSVTSSPSHPSEDAPLTRFLSILRQFLWQQPTDGESRIWPCASKSQCWESTLNSESRHLYRATTEVASCSSHGRFCED